MHAALILSIILRALLAAACVKGIAHAFHDENGFMNGSGLTYYTTQSNLWVLVMTAIYLVLSIITLAAGTFPIPHVLEIARFVVLIGITITFLVFWLLLAPAMEKEYLLSLNNVLVHTLVPILFAADCFLFQRIAAPSAIEVLWVLFMPVYYLIFCLINAAVNPNLHFDNGSRYPYFFMDVDALGWFGFKKGIGVFWWMLILLIATLGLGYLFRFLLML